MTTIDTEKLRALAKRMHAQSGQMQQANAHDPSYCLGWRGATNTYAIELLALLDQNAREQFEAQAEAARVEAAVQNVESITAISASVGGVPGPVTATAECIDCGDPCDPTRNPLRCLVCQLDADAHEERREAGVIVKPYPICDVRGCEQEAVTDVDVRMLCAEHAAPPPSLLDQIMNVQDPRAVAEAWEKANADSARLSFRATPGGLVIERKEPQR